MDKDQYEKQHVVTLYTDATFANKRGACAYWIRHDQGTIKDGATFQAKDSMMAEIIGIERGIKRIIENFPKTQLIIICADCKEALKFTWPWVKLNDKRPDIRRFQENIRSLRDVGIGIRTKHVKGHQCDNSAQTYLNNWCDRESRKFRK